MTIKIERLIEERSCEPAWVHLACNLDLSHGHARNLLHRKCDDNVAIYYMDGTTPLLRLPTGRHPQTEYMQSPKLSTYKRAQNGIPLWSLCNYGPPIYYCSLSEELDKDKDQKLDYREFAALFQPHALSRCERACLAIRLKTSSKLSDLKLFLFFFVSQLHVDYSLGYMV